MLVLSARLLRRRWLQREGSGDDHVPHHEHTHHGDSPVLRWLPVVSAAVVTALGLTIALNGVGGLTG